MPAKDKGKDVHAGRRLKKDGPWQNILDAAAEMFAQSGYSNTTMDALAARLGINKATIYYYFPSKGDILFNICIRILNRMLKRFRDTDPPADARSAIYWIVSNSLHEQQDDPHSTRTYFQEFFFLEDLLTDEQVKDIRDQERHFYTAIRDVIKNGIAEGELRPVDVREHAQLIIGLVNWTYVFDNRRNSGKNLAELITSLLLDGLAVNGTAKPAPAVAGERPSRDKKSNP